MNEQPYSERLFAAVTTVLDNKDLYSHGTLYNDTMKAEVAKILAGDFNVVETFLGIHSRGEEGEIEKRLSIAPRGTWAVIDLSFCNRPIYRGLMSDGRGYVFGRHDAHDTTPRFTEVAKRMAEYEMYLVRKEIEKHRLAEAQWKAIDENDFREGKFFRNIVFHDSKRHTFTTLQITGIDQEGEIHVVGVKRGTKQLFPFSLSPLSLEAIVRNSAELEKAKTGSNEQPQQAA